MHALVVYNPVSGSKKWRDVPSLIEAILHEKKFTRTWFETQPRERQDFSALTAQKYDRIVVCGGDGTVSEVVSWMLKNKIKAPLVVLSLGSANVLARSLNLPFLNLKKALRDGLTLPGKPLDVMCVNGKHIALIAVGRGYDAFLMENTHRASKRRWGPLAYFWTFLKTFLFYRSQPYKITVDGQRFYTVAKQILALNVTPIPELFISGKDGLANLFTVSRFHRVRMWKGRRISIKARRELSFELDGEVFKSKTVTIEVLPKAIEIVYTKSLLHS